MAIRRTFAALKDYLLDGNKEIVSVRTINVVGSMKDLCQLCWIHNSSIIQHDKLFAAFLSGSSFSRSAVNFVASCETLLLECNYKI